MHPVHSKGGSKSRKMQSTESEHLVVLRKALYSDGGGDKDVLSDLAPAFRSFQRNGLDVEIGFSTRLTRKELSKAMEMCSGNMRAVYESSGWGWEEEEKMEELAGDRAARFLLARTRETRELLAFCNFRFTLQGEMQGVMEGMPALFIYDCQILPAAQRKGLGKHLMQMLELMARKQGMSYMMLPVVRGCDSAENFLKSKLRGYEVEEQWSSDAELVNMWSKHLAAPVSAPAKQNNQESTPAKTQPVSALENTKGAAMDRSPVSVLENTQSSPQSSSSGSEAALKSSSRIQPVLSVSVPKEEEEEEAPSQLTTQFDAALRIDQSDCDAVRFSGDEADTPKVEGFGKEERRDRDGEREVVKEQQDNQEKSKLEEQEQEAEEEGGEEDEESEWESAADSEDQADDLLQQLVELFVERNGRDPTEDEMAQWMQTLKEAAEDGGLQL